MHLDSVIVLLSRFHADCEFVTHPQVYTIDISVHYHMSHLRMDVIYISVDNVQGLSTSFVVLPHPS